METRAFYAAALQCLRFVEQRSPTGRRFGDDADSRWKAFKGHLTTVNRIDLLLRDADVEFPGAFGARTTFALEGLASDEPFGAEWPSIGEQEGEGLWRALVREGVAPKNARGALEAIGVAWQLTLTPVTLPAVSPTSRVVVVGPSAIAALAELFASRTDTSWSDQVVCIATPPAHRQLAAAAAALVRSTVQTNLYSAGEAAKRKKEHDILVESQDAHPTDLAAARG